MNKFLALSLLTFVVSCSAKSPAPASAGKNQGAKPVPPTTEPAPVETPNSSNVLPNTPVVSGGGGGGGEPKAEVPLEGNWFQCLKNVEKDSDYLSGSLKLEFQAGGKLETTAKYFVDEACKKPFDAAAAEKLRGEFRKAAEVDAKLYPEIAEGLEEYMKNQAEPYIQALLNGDTSQSSYKVSALNAQGIGEFDITMAGITMYYSYKKSGSEFWISEGCTNGLPDSGFIGDDPIGEPGEDPIEEGEELDNPTRDREGFGLMAKPVQKKLSVKKLQRKGFGLSDYEIPEYCAESPKNRSDSFKDVAPLVKQ